MERKGKTILEIFVITCISGALSDPKCLVNPRNDHIELLKFSILLEPKAAKRGPHRQIDKN